MYGAESHGEVHCSGTLYSVPGFTNESGEEVEILVTFHPEFYIIRASLMLLCSVLLLPEMNFFLMLQKVELNDMLLSSLPAS